MTAIGVDVGGSGIRVQISGPGGTASARLAIALPREEGRVAEAALAAAIVRCAQGIIGEKRADDPTAVCIGTSGYPELLGAPQTLASHIAEPLAAHRVILANDALTSHVGALGLTAGTIVAAGTGAIAVGTDGGGHWQRADGWGHLLGDEGSGAWIGQQALIAVYRAMDGRRDGSESLLRILREQHGDPAAFLEGIYTAPTPAHLFGSFVPHVAAAADEGDPVALRIWSDAGARLANAALAASNGIEPMYSWSGRLFDAGELLLDPFRRTIRAARPDAQFLSPRGTSCDGALRLAEDPDAARAWTNGSAACYDF